MAASTASQWDAVPESDRRYGLIMIDPQIDFCPGGALAVNEGDQVMPILLQLRESHQWVETFVTRDHHPSNHASFASVNGKPVFSTVTLDEPEPGTVQVMWPDHCVQGTPGSEFHPHITEGLKEQGVRLGLPQPIVVHKGTKASVDSYSGFGDAFGGKYERTALADMIKERNITHVAIAGLATDYCVAYTALDAAKVPGLAVAVVLDGCRGINNNGSLKAALQDMERANVRIVKSVEDLWKGNKYDWATMRGL